MSEKLTRREVREAVFLLMYQNEISGTDIRETAEACAEAYEMTVTEEMIKKASDACSKYAELDAVIGEYSKKRDVSRISKVNKSILRLALYEIKYSEGVPAKVAVNEAIELSKKYADKTDSSFINGILGSYLRDSGVNAAE